MKKMLESRRAVVPVLALALVAGLAVPAVSAPGGGSPIDQILAAIRRVAADVRAIADRLEIPPAGPYRLSSGPFQLPGDGAHSVDWTLLNTGSTAQTATVTVYKYGIGFPRTVVAPGALTVTMAPESAAHNANGIPDVFQPGFTYEVVVETDSLAVLPGVQVWKDANATVIPGTLIPSGSWVRLP